MSSPRPSPTSRASKAAAKALAKEKADRVHDRYVVKTYGLEPGQYKAMLDAQDGRCAICMRRAVTRRLAVDHSHLSNRVRGALLCYLCNKYLGQWENDPIALNNLIAYAQAIIEEIEAPNVEAAPKPLVPVNRKAHYYD